MKALSIDVINGHAPYKVLVREDRPNVFYFISDYEIEYQISLKQDFSIVPSGAFSLDIVNASGKPSPSDSKFRDTLIAIIVEFFEVNNDVMLYITETGDEKQSFRNRLFVRWFNTYEHRDRYFILTAEGKLEGQNNFMAIVSRKDNPRLPLAIEEFEETVALLFGEE
jgi:hypothetical protein